MENMKSDKEWQKELIDLRAKLDAIGADLERIGVGALCERCGARGGIEAVLAGVVRRSICKSCLHAFEVDARVRELMDDMQIDTARTEAFIHAGDADKARQAVVDRNKTKRVLEQYVRGWVNEQLEEVSDGAQAEG